MKSLTRVIRSTVLLPIGTSMWLSACGGSGADGSVLPEASSTDAPTSQAQPLTSSPFPAPVLTAAQQAAASSVWEAAAVFLPGSSSRVTVAELPTQKAAIVLLAFHGCSGLGGLQARGPDLASLGNGGLTGSRHLVLAAARLVRRSTRSQDNAKSWSS
jgi:hypothetical protein